MLTIDVNNRTLEISQKCIDRPITLCHVTYVTVTQGKKSYSYYNLDLKVRNVFQHERDYHWKPHPKRPE